MAKLAGGHDLDVGGQGDGPQRAVRRDGHVVGLGHGRDPLELRDAADVRDVGLQDIDAAGLEEGLDVPPRVQPLAQGDGQAGHLAERLDALEVLRQQRLLDEHGPVRLQQRRQLLDHGPVHASVEVDAGVHAELFDGAQALGTGIERGRRVEPAEVFGAVHLDCGEALGLAT